MRMLHAGRQRGVLRRLALSLPFQFLNPRPQLGIFHQQHTDDGLGFRRLASDAFFRDYQRHATVVAHKRRSSPDQFAKNTTPGRERLQTWTG